jgi:hypothetical protein
MNMARSDTKISRLTPEQFQMFQRILGLPDHVSSFSFTCTKGGGIEVSCTYWPVLRFEPGDEENAA